MSYITNTVSLTDESRRKHVYIIGATGVGKSSLLLRMMQDDLSRGRGFALIDPNGDLARAVADSIPPNRFRSTENDTDDVIYFDPLSDNAVRYNPLVTTDPFHRATIASHIVAAFKHIWLDTWGPRLEYILTNALRLMLENPGTTLVDLPRLLTNKGYRTQLLRTCSDPYIKAFWEDEYDNYSDRLRAEAIAPIQNKVGQFANNPILRDIIGHASGVDVSDIMNSRRVLICNLSKRMGAEPSHLLGALLVTAFAQAAQDRDTIPEEQRQDFTLYVDEFQNFATESFTSILAEARKYRLNLVLAHQYLAQLPEGLRDAVLANAYTKIVFRVGVDDAEHFTAQFRLRDAWAVPTPWLLTELEDHVAYVDGARMHLDRPGPTRQSLMRVQKSTAARYAHPRKMKK